MSTAFVLSGGAWHGALKADMHGPGGPRFGGGARPATDRPRRDGAGNDPAPGVIRDRDHVAWRRRCLVTAGFPSGPARELAADERVDIHALLELTDRGCPPLLAMRILAPLDSGSPER